MYVCRYVWQRKGREVKGSSGLTGQSHKPPVLGCHIHQGVERERCCLPRWWSMRGNCQIIQMRKIFEIKQHVRGKQKIKRAENSRSLEATVQVKSFLEQSSPSPRKQRVALTLFDLFSMLKKKKVPVSLSQAEGHDVSTQGPAACLMLGRCSEHPWSTWPSTII